MPQIPLLFSLFPFLVFIVFPHTVRFTDILYTQTQPQLKTMFIVTFIGKRTNPVKIVCCGFERKKKKRKQNIIISSRTWMWTEYFAAFSVSSSSLLVRHSGIVFLRLGANVSAQTNLSLCDAKCHNHATKGENMIHIVFKEWEDKGFLLCFVFFHSSILFCQTRCHIYEK